MKLPKTEYHVEDSEVWLKILGHCTISRKFSNPFRKDSDPSAVLFVSKTGEILFHDFKDGTFNWRNCLKFYLGYTNEQVRDFLFDNNLVIKTHNYTTKKQIRTNTKITYTLKEWCDLDTEYWAQFNVNKEICTYFNVYPVMFTWVNNVICHTYTDSKPVYAFILGLEDVKIYAPYHSQKWLMTTSKEIFQGFEQLPWIGDLLIITKSMKDVMSLYSLEYNAIAPHSEGQKIPNDIIIGLQHRFTKIVVLYDNDDAGIKASNKLNREYKLKQIYMINAKDVSDNIKKCGVNETKKYLKDVL